MITSSAGSPSIDVDSRTCPISRRRRRDTRLYSRATHRCHSLLHRSASAHLICSMANQTAFRKEKIERWAILPIGHGLPSCPSGRAATFQSRDAWHRRCCSVERYQSPPYSRAIHLMRAILENAGSCTASPMQVMHRDLTRAA